MAQSRDDAKDVEKLSIKSRLPDAVTVDAAAAPPLATYTGAQIEAMARRSSFEAQESADAEAKRQAEMQEGEEEQQLPKDEVDEGGAWRPSDPGMF